MIGLKEKLRQKIEDWRPRTKRLVQEFGETVIYNRKSNRRDEGP
jgi:hypothetical protein